MREKNVFLTCAQHIIVFRFSSIGSQSFGDEADHEDNDVDDDEEVAAARERDDQDQGKHLVGFSFDS